MSRIDIDPVYLNIILQAIKQVVPNRRSLGIWESCDRDCS